MKKKILYIILAILGLYYIVILYIPKTYGLKLNNKRIELNLPTLNPNWNLQKIDEINIEYNVYNQVWKNTDTLSFHKTKEVLYVKSFLYSKNRVIQEINTFHNFISESKYEELISKYDFETKSWFITLDTIQITHLKSTLNNNDNSKHELCGSAIVNEGLENGTIGIDKEYLNRILKQWKNK